MNGTLGRDKVWNEQIWGEIDKAVREEMGRIRVAQKVFPSTILSNVQAVPVNTISTAASTPPGLKLDDRFQPFIEMSKAFIVTQVQVDNEESMRVARGLARLVARAIAVTEDNLLFRAQAGSFTAAGIDITNPNAIPDGFVKVAAATPQGAQGDIFKGLTAAISTLNGKNQPGPYALFLSPKQYANTFQPIAVGSAVTEADRIIPLVAGGFYAVNSLTSPPKKPDDIGILVSLGGEPATIYLGVEATTAFAFISERGDYYFRVFERIQLVVRDPDAFVTLDFTKAP